MSLSNAIHLSSWLDRTLEIPVDEDLFLQELDKRRANSRVKKQVESVYNSLYC